MDEWRANNQTRSIRVNLLYTHDTVNHSEQLGSGDGKPYLQREAILLIKKILKYGKKMA